MDTDLPKLKEESKQVESDESDNESEISSVDSKIKYYTPTPEMIEEANKIITQDGKNVSDFLYNKFEKDAKRNWDIFYKNNKTNFFKDRHYIEREFTELAEMKGKEDKFTLCELGCGVGNALYPLLESFPNITCYGFDFSPRAVKMIEEHEVTLKHKDRVHVTVADLVKDPIPKDFPAPNFATLIFVLSAIAPEHFEEVAKKIGDFMKPGSFLFLRDYARYDMA